MKTQTWSITPEVYLPCPWCGSCFSKRKQFLKHVKQCYDRRERGELDMKIKFYFLKPKY